MSTTTTIKKTYKRPRTRRGRPKRNKTRISRAMTNTAFPSSKFCKMTYADNWTLTSTTGTPGGWIFNINSLFDPDQTGVGHQPYFYDQLAAIYNAYVVTACKIEITGSASSNASVTLRSTTSPTVPSNLTLEMERPKCKKAFFTATGNGKTITNYTTCAALFGRSKSAITDEDDFRGAGGSPAQRGYWALCIQHPDQSSTVSMYVNIKITYYCKWMNLKVLNQS